jgi:hypothetical protein
MQINSMQIYIYLDLTWSITVVVHVVKETTARVVVIATEAPLEAADDVIVMRYHGVANCMQ